MSTFALILLCLLIFIIGMVVGVTALYWYIVDEELIVTYEEDEILLSFKSNR